MGKHPACRRSTWRVTDRELLLGPKEEYSMLNKTSTWYIGVVDVLRVLIFAFHSQHQTTGLIVVRGTITATQCTASTTRITADGVAGRWDNVNGRHIISKKWCFPENCCLLFRSNSYWLYVRAVKERWKWCLRLTVTLSGSQSAVSWGHLIPIVLTDSAVCWWPIGRMGGCEIVNGWLSIVMWWCISNQCLDVKIVIGSKHGTFMS